MELKKIIGQLFMIGFQGDTLYQDNQIVEDIVKRNLGGVILFDRFLAGKRKHNNITSVSQLKSLNNELQKLTDNKLLIGIDQEGGRVCRLKEERGFPKSASAHEICAKNDIEFTLNQAELVASTLAEVGVNFNFAPVADLDINPDNPVIGRLQRSFSAKPDRVIEQCEIWLDCHRKNGVLGCLKHFPGHGSSKDDSHLGFVDITDSWQETELAPYRELISRNKVDAIMMGHLYHSRMDADHPASLSPHIIGQVLRKELHFEGAIITDDMQMKAITDKYSLRESIVLALKAGADLIIFGNNLTYDPDILSQGIGSIEDAVKNKQLSIDRIMSSYKRVQQLKRALK